MTVSRFLAAAKRLARRALAVPIAALVLAGCSTLPSVAPDLRPVDPGSVQFQAASGRILSPERSRALIEKLAGSGEQADVLARHLALEQAVSDSPLTLGNRVVLLEDGPATYAAMFAAIDSARNSINMETYILEGDDTGERFAAALLAKAAQGVQVNLIRDSVGTLGTPSAFFKRLTDGGVNVVEFNPVNPLAAKAGWDVNQRDHRKLLIADGRIAIMGGINISSVYSGGSSSRSGSSGGHKGKDKDKASSLPWRDTDLQIEGQCGGAIAEAVLRHVGRPEGPAPAIARNYFPAAVRARAAKWCAPCWQHARRALQPDLRDADLRHQQRRERDSADQRLLRARPAAGAGADRVPWRAAST